MYKCKRIDERHGNVVVYLIYGGKSIAEVPSYSNYIDIDIT